jgi:hypothetical protein
MALMEARPAPTRLLSLPAPLSSPSLYKWRVSHPWIRSPATELDPRVPSSLLADQSAAGAPARCQEPRRRPEFANDLPSDALCSSPSTPAAGVRPFRSVDHPPASPLLADLCAQRTKDPVRRGSR